MWVLAVLSLVVGSALAVVQTNVKRMLAYSSISHAGFVLVGVEAAGHRAGEPDPGSGMPSVATYLLVYSVLVIGSFAVVALVERGHGGDSSLESFKGLAARRPALAIALTVFLLAQAGVPLTSGFVAKFAVIRAAVEQRSYAIGIIAMVAAVIAAFLYLRIMVNVWLEPADDESSRSRCRSRRRLAIAGCRRVHPPRRRVARLAPRRHRHRHPIRPLTPPPTVLSASDRRVAAFEADSSGFQAGVREDSRRSATRRATRSLLARRFISRSRACSPSASRPVTFSTSHCRSTTGTRICSWCTARS